jgi:hypothetical protein
MQEDFNWKFTASNLQEILKKLSTSLKLNLIYFNFGYYLLSPCLWIWTCQIQGDFSLYHFNHKLRLKLYLSMLGNLCHMFSVPSMFFNNVSQLECEVAKNMPLCFSDEHALTLPLTDKISSSVTCFSSGMVHGFFWNTVFEITPEKEITRV